MTTGSLKFLDRGFGFITRDDGILPNVFIHEREARKAGIMLVPGLRLAFDVEVAPRGPRAVNISLDAPHGGETDHVARASDRVMSRYGE